MFRKLNPNERVCPLCNSDQIDDERNFVMNCPVYVHVVPRRLLFNPFTPWPHAAWGSLYIVIYLPPRSAEIFIINCIVAAVLKEGYTQCRRDIPMCFIRGIPGTEWAVLRSGERVI